MLILLLLTAAIAFRWQTAQAPVAPVNDRPSPYQRVEPWGELPAGTSRWAAVIGAEPGPDGNIYVMHRCFENSCAGRPEPPILKLSPEGKLLAAWGAGMFVFPHGFHVDRQGNVWATDARVANGQGAQVFKFDQNGKLLLTLGKAGVAAEALDTFTEPTDVVTASNGDIFVSDGHNAPTNRVVKFSKEGRFIRTWGKSGSGPGEFESPHTIAIDSRDRLFVGDRANNRIQIFDLEGRFLAQWRQFGRPSGIYITADDTIYVADSESWGLKSGNENPNPGWKKGIRIGSARDGAVRYFIEDIESTADDNSGAEGVGVDRHGNVYGAVVRRRMLEKHVPIKQEE